MTQEITVVPVDARTADWPRKVATVLNRLQNTTALAGGSAAWGGITGTLSAQTDLQSALNTKQASDATLTALAAYNTNGLLTQTGADTFTGRTLTAGSSKISIANGNGVSGNPTVDLGSVASTDLSNSANIALLNGGQTFTADISVPDEAYGVGWNGSLEVPTKNAIYDKIETIAGGGVPDGDKGDITVSSSGSVWTVDNDAITYAKIQNVSATDRLLGRDTASAGDIEELTVSGGLEFTGSGGIQRSALTGDVTASAGNNATTIANDAVTYAKMQNVTATDKVLGRSTAGSGDVEEIACTSSGRAMIAASSAIAQHLLLFSGAMVKKSADLTGQNLSAAATAMAFNTEIYDVGGWFNSASSTTRLSVPSGVSYVQVGATIVLANVTASSEGQFLIEKNGGTGYDGIAWQSLEFPSGTVPPRINLCSGPIPVVGGTDYFELFCQVTTDTSIDISAANTNFWIRALG